MYISKSKENGCSVQWNPSMMDTFGSHRFVPYSEVSQTQGFRYISGSHGMYNRAVEHNMAPFSELLLYATREG